MGKSEKTYLNWLGLVGVDLVLILVLLCSTRVFVSTLQDSTSTLRSRNFVCRIYLRACLVAVGDLVCWCCYNDPVAAIVVQPGCWSFHGGRCLLICGSSPFRPISSSRLYFGGVELGRSCGDGVDILRQSLDWKFPLAVFQ